MNVITENKIVEFLKEEAIAAYVYRNRSDIVRHINAVFNLSIDEAYLQQLIKLNDLDPTMLYLEPKHA